MASAPMLVPMPLPPPRYPADRNFPKSIFLMNSGARDYSESLAVAAGMRASVCIMENHLGDLAKCRRTGRQEREIINQDQLLLKRRCFREWLCRKTFLSLETSLPARKPPRSAGISNPSRQATHEMPLKVSPDVTNVGVFHLTKLSNHRASFRRKSMKVSFSPPTRFPLAASSHRRCLKCSASRRHGRRWKKETSTHNKFMLEQRATFSFSFFVNMINFIAVIATHQYRRARGHI